MIAYSTADQARHFERQAARGVAYEAQDIMRDMQRRLDDLAHVLGQLQYLAGKQDWMALEVAGLRDLASNVQGTCRPLIEDAGLLGDFVPFDLSELEAL